ncbi:MAG: 4'-phosphopantetheinyl transferase superfamily protein, partial [Burkholderiales bacterium]
AGIFAAKEAIFKAVNKLLPIKLTQIAIQHDENGKPVVWPEDDMISPPIGNKWLGTCCRTSSIRWPEPRWRAPGSPGRLQQRARGKRRGGPT